MTGISFLEIIVVIIAVVIFVKPEDMPAFFRRIGQIYAQFQHYIRRVRSYTADTFDEISRLDIDPARPAKTPPPAAPPPIYGPVARGSQPPDDPQSPPDQSKDAQG